MNGNHTAINHIINIAIIQRLMLDHIPIITEKKATYGENKPDHNIRHKTSGTPPKIDIRGMTLKQYMMICETQNPIEQLQEDSRPSSTQQITPQFAYKQNRAKNGHKLKIKTELSQDQIENHHKNNHIRNIPQKPNKRNSGNVSFYGADKHQHEQIQFSRLNFQPKKSEGKAIDNIRIKSIPSRTGMNFLKKSAMKTFYQLDVKKKVMMQKVKKDHNRSKEMKLSDAFLITKYGSRFQSDIKKKNIIKQIFK